MGRCDYETFFKQDESFKEMFQKLGYRENLLCPTKESLKFYMKTFEDKDDNLVDKRLGITI